MALSLRTALVGALAFVALGLPAVSSAPDPAAPAAPAPLGRDDQKIKELVARIESARHMRDGRLFKQLTAFKSNASFEAIKRVTKPLQGEHQLKWAYAAFENYKGVDGLEGKAIEWVASKAIKGREPQRRAAARGLARFGMAAESELRLLLTRSKDPKVRAWAVGPLVPSLTAEGTPGALGQILDNARPGPSGSREALASALGAFLGERNTQAFFGFLRGREPSPAMAVMAIEVIRDRQEPGVARALISAMKSSDSSVQLAAMAALDARGETSHATALGKLIRDDDELVRRQAVISLGRLRGADESLIDELRDLATAKDPATRQGAVVALAELRTQEALQALYLLLADTDHLVRREALQEVGNLRRRETLPALIGRLNGEKGRLKIDLITTLRLITGLDNGTSYDRWKRWYDAEGETFEIPDYDAALRAERERQRHKREGRTVTSFYGLKIVSDRICFVLDVSGSMQAQSGRGTRIHTAKQQLLDVLEKYPEGDLFNVIFFSSDAYPWQDELARMNKKTRKAALEYVSRQTADGATALYDALELAFEDRRIDTIFLLTDGQPTGGKVDDPGQIRQEVRRWNASRHVEINCISVGGGSQLLKQLASDSKGEYKEVR